MDLSQLQEVILEIIQIPTDRLLVKPLPGVADRVVQIPPSRNLKVREDLQYPFVEIDQTAGKVLGLPNGCDQGEESFIAQILLQIDVAIQIGDINLWHRKTVSLKMRGESEEGYVFSSVWIEHPDDAPSTSDDTIILPARTMGGNGQDSLSQLP